MHEGVPPAVQFAAASQGTQRAAAQVVQLYTQSDKLQQRTAASSRRRSPSKGCYRNYKRNIFYLLYFTLSCNDLRYVSFLK